MKREQLIKYGVFLFAVVVLVAVDQWTKNFAEDRLATRGMSHARFAVGDDHDGSTVQEYLEDELSWNTGEEIDEIAARFTADSEGQLLAPDDTVSAGDTVEVMHREVVVVEGYWDFQYTRNPGAAFGLLSDANEKYRKPFFIIVSILAVGIILGLLKGVPFRQQLLFWGLVLICAGAVGNFIDRVQFGYVVDFVVWKYSDDYRWPTFNVADALICVGVAFMVLEIIRDTVAGSDEDDEDES